jgi:putative nucleotidyltransferase with HDIG domain
MSSASAETPNDWAVTVDNLVNLAKQAGQKFSFEQAIEYLHAAEEIWNSKGLPDYSLERRVEVHREAGKAYTSLGKIDHAIAEYQKILTHCQDASHNKIKAETFTQIAQLVAKQGDHDRALGYLHRAIAAFRRLDDKPGICKALRNLGVIYVELGEFEEGESTFTESIALAAVIGERVLYADLVNNLGAIMNMRGNPRRALELYAESLEIYDAHNEIRKAAYARNNIAITLFEGGKLDEALEKFTAAGEVAHQIKDASLALIVNINLADLHLRRGAHAEAKKNSAAAERYLVENELRNGHLVEIKKIAGKIASGESDFISAIAAFNEALIISREVGAKYQEAEILTERGLVMQTQGKNFEALADLEAGWQIFKTMKVEGKRHKIRDMIESVERLYLEIFDAMSRDVDRKDPYTKGHSDRVASMALLLAREVGLKGTQLKCIVAGALLHDIGKIKVDDAILNKPGRLTDDEFAVIKRHPQYGLDLLTGKEFPWDIRPIIHQHHERVKGSGYPAGLKGDEIAIGARIVCISDVFDALTSDRVYRAAYDPAKAVEIMQKESGTTFDTMLLNAFMRMVESGKADLVISARTHRDEMYAIWSSCLAEEEASMVSEAPQEVAVHS